MPMGYTLFQTVRIVDMNDEMIHEVLFEHGKVESTEHSIGATVVH